MTVTFSLLPPPSFAAHRIDDLLKTNGITVATGPVAAVGLHLQGDDVPGACGGVGRHLEGEDHVTGLVGVDERLNLAQSFKEMVGRRCRESDGIVAALGDGEGLGFSGQDGEVHPWSNIGQVELDLCQRTMTDGNSSHAFWMFTAITWTFSFGAPCSLDDSDRVTLNKSLLVTAE